MVAPFVVRYNDKKRDKYLVPIANVKYHKRIINALRPKPEWSALCLLKESINRPPFEYEGGNYIHPAIGIYGYVSRLRQW